MKKIFTGKTFLFTFCVLLALLTNWVFGVHYGVASENYWVSRWVQEYPKGSAILDLELFLFGISYVINGLSALNHNINFLAIFLWGANLLSVFLVLETVSHRLKHIRNYVFVAFFFAILFAENFVFLDLTRTAVSLSFAGILFGVYNQGKKPRILVAIVAIVLGLSIRPAVGYLGLFFFMITVLSKYFYGMNIWDIRRRLLPIFLILLSFVGGSLIYTNNDFTSVNKQRSKILDRGYEIANEDALNEEDLLMFKKGYVGFESLKQTFYPSLKLKLSFDEVKEKIRFDLQEKANFYPYILLLLLLMAIPLPSKKMYFLILLWTISIIILSAFYKLPNRLFYPYSGMFLLMMFMVYPKSYRVKRVWVKLLLFSVFALAIGKLELRARYTLQKQKYNDDLYYSLIDESKGKYLFASNMKSFTMYLNPFKNYGEQDLKGLIGLKGWPTLLSGYNQTINYTFGCEKYSDIFTDSRYEEHSLYLLSAKEADLISNYIQQKRGKKISFVKETSLENTEMNLYRVKR